MIPPQFSVPKKYANSESFLTPLVLLWFAVAIRHASHSAADGD